jgi:hypothetical protein
LRPAAEQALPPRTASRWSGLRGDRVAAGGGLNVLDVAHIALGRDPPKAVDLELRLGDLAVAERVGGNVSPEQRAFGDLAASDGSRRDLAAADRAVRDVPTPECVVLHVHAAQGAVPDIAALDGPILDLAAVDGARGDAVGNPSERDEQRQERDDHRG